ncbi:hypothetical protein ACLI1A_02085 [Flavobacterium sp. RHBU_3]|uniref:hypothetical protein n=1 Tax=Flavobacterium sp. RHBU_3 TaxID=3391184 RepID=UPI003984775B
MEKQDLVVSFSTLREAYCEVKSFIEKETWDKVKSLSTTIDGDLGCSGDDNYELLVKFTDKYDLNHEGFDYSAHFLSEGELFGSGSAFLHAIMIPLYIIKMISFGKINLLPPDRYFHRETSDLTFGDMLAWYLTKEFKHRSDLNIKLPVNA